MSGVTSSGLLKTVLFLTKTMFTFFIISLLIYLNFADLQENNSNRSYLNLLKSVAEKHHASELLFKDYELKRLDTLKVLNPQVYAKHNSSRVALVRTLNRYGAFITRASKGGGDKRNNTIMLMSNDSLRTLFASAVHNPSSFFTKPGGNYNDNSRDETVGDALDIFNAYPQQEKVTLLTVIDTALLAQKCDSLLQHFADKNNLPRDSTGAASPARRNGIVYTGNHYRPGEEAYDNGTGGPSPVNHPDPETGLAQKPTVKSTLFGDNQVFNGLCIYQNEVVIFITDAQNSGTGNNLYEQSTLQGADQKTYTISVPAQTQTIMFPSTLVFAGYPSGLVHDLGEEDRQSGLHNEYGNAKLDMIDAISVAIYNKNNSPISILGFDLSRKWFPIALCVVITILSVLLFQTVSNLRTLPPPVATDSNTDDVLHFLTDNRFIRFFLWVLAAPLILFLVLLSSPIQYSHWLLYGLLFCCAVSMWLGIVSYARFLKR